MTIVDQVALWAGLIASIVSIVLSFVAIAFAILVDRSSRQVTAQTIKSLQKIETEVERLSGDTREIIKAGWDKMLGSSYPAAASQSDANAAKELAAGIASELRAELNIPEKTSGPEETRVMARFDEAIKELESTVAAQIRSEPTNDRTGSPIARAEELLRSVSPAARALAERLSSYHLTRQQYVALSKGPLADALSELRRSGILVPLTGKDDQGKEVPVYYYPPQLTKPLRAVVSVMPSPNGEVRELVTSELKRINYGT